MMEMVHVKEKPQVSLFGDSRERVHAKLKGWYKFTQQIERNKRLLELDKMELRTIEDQISSSIIQRYDNMDMPRGTSIGDKTGNMAALIVDRKRELEFEIARRIIEIKRLEKQLAEIETAVEQLNPRDAEIVKRYYLWGERWESICVRMRIQKSRFYEILDRVLDVLGDQL
jgi:hypothetical protein